MSHRRPFKPFKRPPKSPYDENGPNDAALRRSLTRLQEHGDAASNPTAAELLKCKSAEAAEHQQDHADNETGVSVEAATRAEPDPPEPTPATPEPPKAEPDPIEDLNLGNIPTNETQAGAQAEASVIHEAQRPPRRPLINSRRIRRVDDANPANPARHRRCCIVCHHDDRHAIEQAFLEWHRPNDIRHEFKLPNRTCIYRHARATGLFEKRARDLRYVLEKIMEESTCQPPSADSLIRAVRAYSCLDANGHWIEPPKHVIITRDDRRQLRQSEPELPPRPPEKLISIEPDLIEQGA